MRNPPRQITASPDTVGVQTKSIMTRIKNNAMLKGIRGKFGETHSYRKVRGKMQMVSLPDREAAPSEKQKQIQEQFLKASNYAKAQMLDLVMKAEYQTGITKTKHSAFIVALTDVLNAPKVNEIDTSDYRGKVGDIIAIQATDDFKVIRVRVIITSAEGSEIERGEAVQDLTLKNTWRYAATVANPVLAGSTVSVTAFDIPQNKTTLDKVLE